MEHTTLSVQIAGRDYTLTSADSPVHTQRVASLVVRALRELMAVGIINQETEAVMAALTLADELIKSQDDNTRLRRKLDESTHG